MRRQGHWIGLAIMVVATGAAAKTPEELFDQGLRQLQGGDPGGARVSFMEAYAEGKQPRMLLQLVVSELRSNRPLDALRHMREYVKDPRTSATDREQTKLYMEEALQRTGHIRVEVPKGAELSVDSARIGVAPLVDEVDVEADKECDLAATHNGVTKHQSAHVPAGRTITIRFEGLPTGTTVTVATPNNAAPSGTAAGQGATPPGSTKDEGSSSSARIIVPAIIAGVGVGSLIASGVFASSSNSAKRDAETAAASGPCAARDSASCNDLRALQDKQNSGATLSYVFLGTGIVALVGAAAVYAIWPKKSAGSVGYNSLIVRF
jgi:hypothetical protein